MRNVDSPSNVHELVFGNLLALVLDFWSET